MPPEIEAWPRQGSEFNCWGRPRNRYARKTPEPLTTGLWGVLGKKYANDTFYGNKHIAFPSLASAEMEFVQASSFPMIYGGMPNWHGG
jgi:hypothetical protein